MSPFCATSIQDLPAILGCHTSPKPVRVFSFAVVRLKCSLHASKPRSFRIFVLGNYCTNSSLEKQGRQMHPGARLAGLRVAKCRRWSRFAGVCFISRFRPSEVAQVDSLVPDLIYGPRRFHAATVVWILRYRPACAV